MKPPLVLHIGVHKTGTTAIQNRLAASKAADLRYVVVTGPARPMMLNDTPDPAAIAALRDAVPLPDDPATLTAISFEGFAGHYRTGYTNAGAAAHATAEAFSAYDTRVVVYLRRQDRVIESMVRQLVKTDPGERLDTYLAGLGPDSYNWLNLLNAWSDAFGAAKVLPRIYDRAALAAEGGVFADFCRTIGRPDLSENTPDPESNPSYTAAAVELAQMCGPHLPESHWPRLRSALEAWSARPEQRAADRSLIEPDVRDALLARYTGSNEQVRARWFPDRVVLFD